MVWEAANNMIDKAHVNLENQAFTKVSCIIAKDLYSYLGKQQIVLQ